MADMHVYRCTSNESFLNSFRNVTDYKAVNGGGPVSRRHWQSGFSCRHVHSGKDFKFQPRLVPVYPPLRDDTVGRPEQMWVSILPKDVTRLFITPAPRIEPRSLGHVSGALTTEKCQTKEWRFAYHQTLNKRLSVKQKVLRQLQLLLLAK